MVKGKELAIKAKMDSFTMGELATFARVGVTYGYTAMTLELLLSNGDNTNDDGESFGVSIKALSNQHNLNHRVVIGTLEEMGLIDNETKSLTAKGFLETNGITAEELNDMTGAKRNKIRPLLEYRNGGWRIDRSNDNFQNFWNIIVDEIGSDAFNKTLKKQKHPQTESTQKLIRAIRKGFRDGA